MKKLLKIKRQNAPDGLPFWEDYEYEIQQESDTVATALFTLPVVWEKSCLQKKCGACAMVVNGKPVLACDTVLSHIKSDTVVIEPLRKFPVVKDLMVDRESMMRKLKELEVWLRQDAEPVEEEMAFEASKCLQCGLCLEICPNYYPDGTFGGMAGMAPMARLLAKAGEDDRKEIGRNYQKGIYEGCGKSLACRKICPAGMDMDHLLIKSNAIAVWKHFRKRKNGKK